MNLRAFTLIEMMVGVAIFTIITAIVAGLFIYAVRIQRQVLARQELIDQVSYVVEYISRAVRMAKKELNDPPTCLTSDPNSTPGGRGYNYQLTRLSGGIYKGIKFINMQNECQEFFWDDAINQLKESRAGIENVISSPSLEILTFRPVISGAYQGEVGSPDNLQPRATFLLEVRKISPKPEERPSIKIQTTISQRNLDVLE